MPLFLIESVTMTILLIACNQRKANDNYSAAHFPFLRLRKILNLMKSVIGRSKYVIE